MDNYDDVKSGSRPRFAPASRLSAFTSRMTNTALPAPRAPQNGFHYLPFRFVTSFSQTRSLLHGPSMQLGPRLVHHELSRA